MSPRKSQYKIIFLIILVAHIQSTWAQIPDDINGRLWRLAKVWGYTKYFHPNQCHTDWNLLLAHAIDSTLTSTSTASFNAILLEVLQAVGEVPHATGKLVNPADINFNAQFDWMDDPLFSEDVRGNLDSIEVNFRPKWNCFVKLNDGSTPGYNGFLDFNDDDISIPSFSYTQESHRLLVLFYYWNIIQYFHADRNLMDQPWDSTLYQFIPIIRSCQTEVDFHVQFLRLVSHINDTHGFTGSPMLDAYFGSFYPQLKVDYVENQTIITKKGVAFSDIGIGDLIKRINGIDITHLRDSLSAFLAASNPSALHRDLNTLLLEGTFGSNIELELEDSTGSVYSKSVIRGSSSSDYYTWANADPNPVWKVTECGYGYVNMGKLQSSQIPQLKNLIKNIPAVIFDVRNYPNGTINNLIPILFPSPITYALFTVPEPTYPGWYSWSDNQGQVAPFTNPDPYDGKVIILVNATTQSHAEYTVMGLQQHPNAYTIGSQTAGADGNVSAVYLPGSLYTYWTSLGIYYPDSATAQRIGVRIDSVVTPTITGIRAGRDEVLEAALDCLISSNKVPGRETSFEQNLNVFPNPAMDQIHYTLPEDWPGGFKISILDCIGRQVYTATRSTSDMHQVYNENISTLSPGLYTLSLIGERMFVSSFIISK